MKTIPFKRFSKKIYQILFFLLLTGWTAESTYAQATRLGDTIYLDRALLSVTDPFTVSSSNDGSRISIGSPGNPVYIYEYNNSSWEETIIIDNRDELLVVDTTILTPHNQQHSTTAFNNNGTRVAIGYSS